MTPAPRTLAEVGRELRPSTCCACVAELEGEVKRLGEENERLREDAWNVVAWNEGHGVPLLMQAIEGLRRALTETPERER